MTPCYIGYGIRHDTGLLDRLYRRWGGGGREKIITLIVNPASHVQKLPPLDPLSQSPQTIKNAQFHSKR